MENVMGIDPQFSDPDNLDFSLLPGSPAEGRGCRVFAPLREKFSQPFKKPILNIIRDRDPVEVSGEITGSEVWSADTVLVVGDVNVLPEAQLTIAAGVVVQFSGYFQIEVLGSMIAQGTADERIIFTHQNPEDYSFDGSHRSAWNGIRFPFTSAVQDSSFFEYCLFEYAKATGDTAQAGAVLSVNRFSKLKLENCLFRYNVADRGGAIACRTLSSPLIINNLMHDNYCLFTGAVFYNEYSYPRLINNTIVDNWSINQDMWTPSCAITNYFSKPVLQNNIIWENETTYFLGGEIFEARPYNYGVNIIDQELNAQNINQNPQLTDQYQLTEASIGVDNGGCDLFAALPQFDLAGNERVSGAQVDIGCYEFQITEAINDLMNPGLMKIYPNPFNPSTTIRYQLAEEQIVTIKIFNIKGQKVTELVNEIQTAGSYKLGWQPDDQPSGIYLLRFKAGNYSQCSKLVLLK
jgi:predicted outer membrane repeat protein